MLGLFGRRAQPPADPVQEEIRQIMQQGVQAQEQGQAHEALKRYEHGLQLSRMHQRAQPEQTFLNSIGAVHVGLKNFEAAETAFNEALSLAESLNQSVLVARSLNNLGELYAAQQDWPKAQRYHEKALTTARPTGDAPTIILTLENLARDYMEQENPSYATHLLKEAVALAQAKQDSYLGIGVLGRLGEATMASNDAVAGRKLIEQAIRLGLNSSAGRPRLIMRWLIKLGTLDLESKQYQNALRLLQQAEDVAHRFGVQSSEFFMSIAIKSAEANLYIGNHAAALDQTQRAQLHAQQLGKTEELAKIDGYLGLALQGTNKHAEATKHLEAALQHYADGTLHNPDEQARLLLALGRSQQESGATDDALVTYNQVLESLDENDSPARRAEALQLVAAVQNMRKERDEAIQLYLEAERLYRAAGELHNVARVLTDLGSTRRAKGDFKMALTDFENALMLLSNIDDRITRGLVMSNAAIIYTETGDVDTAQSFFEKSIQLARETNDKYAESVRLGNYGWLQLSIGRYASAIETIERSMEISRNLNDVLLLGIQMNNLGWTHHLNNETDEGKRLLEQALSHVESANTRQWHGIVRSNLGAVLMAQDKLDTADRSLRQALEDSQTADDHENVIRTEIRLARLLHLQDQHQQAEADAQSAETAARKLFFRKGQADALHLLGDINAAMSEKERARFFYTEAQRVFKMIHDPLANQMERNLKNL